MYEAAQIISAFRYHKLNPTIHKPEDHKIYFLNLPYINKGIDLIGVSSIFRDSNVLKHIPPYFDNMEPPIISYTYKKNLLEVLFLIIHLLADILTSFTVDLKLCKFKV